MTSGPQGIKSEKFPSRWVKSALRNSGYTLEELSDKSYEELRGIEGVGHKVALNIWNHYHPDLQAETLPSGKRAYNIPIANIERAKWETETWEHFGVSSKKEFDKLDVSNEDIARFILRRDKAGKGIDQSASKIKAVITEDEEREIRTKELEDRVQEYLKDFETVTPNDVAALRNLAFLNMEADIIQQSLLKFVGKHDPESIDSMDRLNKQMVEISKETRQLEAALGIVREERVDKGAEPIDVLRDAMGDAEWLLQQEIHEVVHRCDDGKIIPIMAIWHYFPTHPHETFKQQCPNCGAWLTVEYKKRGLAVSAKDFEIDDLLQIAKNIDVTEELENT